MPRNDTATPAHVCSGILIHIIDIVQPPGIGIPPMADIDVHQTIVIVALIATSGDRIAANAVISSTPFSARRTVVAP